MTDTICPDALHSTMFNGCMFLSPNFFQPPPCCFLWEGRDVVFANDPVGVPVLAWIANMTRELTLAENAVFGPNNAANVTTEPVAAVSCL